jgi:hypothetical protein
MPAGEGRYFYDSGSGTIGWKDVKHVSVESVGTTKDGIEIYRFSYTYAQNGRLKVYLALKMNGLYHNILGSGFDQLPGKSEGWSGGRIYDLNEIRNKTSSQLTLR